MYKTNNGFKIGEIDIGCNPSVPNLGFKTIKRVCQSSSNSDLINCETSVVENDLFNNLEKLMINNINSQNSDQEISSPKNISKTIPKTNTKTKSKKINNKKKTKKKK